MKRFPITQKALRELENAKKALQAELYDQAVDTADKAVETILRGWLEEGARATRETLKERPAIIEELKRMGYAVPVEWHIQSVRILRNKIRYDNYPVGQQDAEITIGIVEKFIDEACKIELKKAVLRLQQQKRKK